jgi:hypothetical protein
MVIVMDMSTGKFEKLNTEEAAAEEFGPFVDEVLDAGWLPQPSTQLAVHEHTHEHVAHRKLPDVEPEVFLRDLYRNQE